MEETLIKAFNCADSLPRCCFIWHLKVGRAVLRSPPCERLCGGGEGAGAGRDFRLPLFSQEPWLSMKAAVAALPAPRLIWCLVGSWGEAGRERGVLCWFNNNKPTRDVGGLTLLGNEWPGESRPPHLAPARLLAPPCFGTRASRAPAPPLEAVPVAAAQGRERGAARARHKSQGDGREALGRYGCQIASATKSGCLKSRRARVSHMPAQPRSLFPEGKL